MPRVHLYSSGGEEKQTVRPQPEHRKQKQKQKKETVKIDEEQKLVALAPLT